MKIQEKQIVLRYLDRIIEKIDNNPLLLECLYSLGVELSSKNSEEALKYSKLLFDFRSTNYQDLDPIPVGDFGKIWSKNGFYRFNFNDATTARQNKMVLIMVKDFFNFNWDSHENAWLYKQSNRVFDVKNFVETIERSYQTNKSR